jgi:ParB/RepB/Spo0J family partition protein
MDAHCIATERTKTMQRNSKQKALLDGEIQQVDEKLLTLMRRLGIESLPSHETMLLARERIVVPGEALIMRPSKRLVKSIQRVGILQAPSVVVLSGTSPSDPEATFEVMIGRRRVLAAGLAGLQHIKCEVYASSTPQLSSLLALVENAQRSAAWIKEVEDLRRLIDDGVGLTIDDLADVGFDRGALTERLKIALLPASILNLIFAGTMRLDVAKKIARLNPTQQAKVAQLAEDGGELTADQIKSVLRAQIDTGLAPLQTALSQAWEQEDVAEPIANNGRSASFPESVPRSNGSEPVTPRSMASVLATLQGFEQQLASDHSLPQVRLLTRALVQQLQVTLRQSNPHPQSEHKEGETVHV